MKAEVTAKPLETFNEFISMAGYACIFGLEAYSSGTNACLKFNAPHDALVRRAQRVAHESQELGLEPASEKNRRAKEGGPGVANSVEGSVG